MRKFFQRFNNHRSDPEASQADVSGLGLPLEKVETDPQLARYGSYGKMVVALAWDQLNAGKLEDAIANTGVLIDDTNLQRNAKYVLILAAAHYVRGLAFEENGNFSRARSHFQAALKLSPGYELANRALARVQK